MWYNGCMEKKVWITFGVWCLVVLFVPMEHDLNVPDVTWMADAASTKYAGVRLRNAEAGYAHSSSTMCRRSTKAV